MDLVFLEYKAQYEFQEVHGVQTRRNDIMFQGIAKEVELYMNTSIARKVKELFITLISYPSMKGGNAGTPDLPCGSIL